MLNTGRAYCPDFRGAEKPGALFGITEQQVGQVSLGLWVLLWLPGFCANDEFG